MVGATNATLSLTAITAEQQGRYELVVTDDDGSVTSQSAWVYLRARAYVPPAFIPPTIAIPAAIFNDQVMVFEEGASVPHVTVDSTGKLYALSLGLVTPTWTQPFSQVATLARSPIYNIVTSAFSKYYVALNWDRQVVQGWNPGFSVGAAILYSPADVGPCRAVAASGHYGMALKNDGTVAVWNSTGLVNNGAPDGLTNVVQIAAGTTSCFALRADGTVVYWHAPPGTGGWATAPVAQTPPVGVDIGIKRIAACNFYPTDRLVVLRNSGTPASWQVTAPDVVALDSVTDGIAVNAGFTHASVLRASGSVQTFAGAPSEEHPLATTINATGLGGDYNNLYVLGGQTAPTIVAPPADQTLMAGDSATLTVASTGFPVPTFQWKKDGVPIPNAVLNHLDIPQATVADAGTYTVDVTNRYGTASANAVVTVTPAPLITQQPPAEAAGIFGQPLTISAQATGNGTLSFQWYRNGLPIAGANTASLTIGSLGASDAGLYTVTATDADGSRSSHLSRVGLVGQMVMWNLGSFVRSAGHCPIYRVLRWRPGMGAHTYGQPRFRFEPDKHDAGRGRNHSRRRRRGHYSRRRFQSIRPHRHRADGEPRHLQHRFERQWRRGGLARRASSDLSQSAATGSSGGEALPERGGE